MGDDPAPMTAPPTHAPLRLHSAAAERNRDAILAQLQRLLAPQGVALEVASGSGQHAAHFAAALPGWRWQPTDADARALPSIDAWCAGLANVDRAIALDILTLPWPGVPAVVDLVYSANLLHIAPWATCAALMQGSAQHLSPQGLLCTYGPYVQDDVETAPSNLAFDADLRARNPAWGLRRLSDVADQARLHGLCLRERIAMPTNNLLLVWARCKA